MEVLKKELPDGWEWKQIKDFVKKVNSIDPTKEPDKQFYYIDIDSINNSNQTIQNPKLVIGNEAPSRARQIVKHDDILFSTVRPYLKNIALIDRIYDSQVASTGFCVIRVNERVDNKYLFYYLRSDAFLNELKRYYRGANYPAISDSDLLYQQFPLPPIDTQRKIVAILEKAEATQRLRAEADALTQELQRSAFLEIFGNPVKNEKGWVKKPLREFGEIITGNTPPRERAEYYGNHIEWIKSDNINTPFTYLTRSEEMLSKQGADVGRIAPKGSVLITCIAGSISCIGNTAIADREVAFNQQINAIVPNKSVNPVFLYHLFRNSQGYIQKFSTHSMKGMISKGVLSSIPLILPPVEIQDSFASIAQQIEEIRNQQHESTYEVSSLLNALMSKAFIGELISN